MFDPSTLHGIIPPMCTPLTENGEIDVRSVHSLVDFLIASGVHGIFALGTSGEFASLTKAQKKTLIAETVAAARGRVPVLCGITDNSTGGAIDNGRVAKEAGVDAVVLSTPFYFRISQREIRDHFHAVSAAVGLPMLAYDIPGLDVATLKTLFDEGVICGLKDSSGVIDAFREILMATRGSNFRIFTGSELLVDTVLHMGAHGSVPGVSNAFPAEYVHLYNLAKAGDWAGATAIQERLFRCFRELISQGDLSYSFIASALGSFKAALKAKGVIATSRLAAPLHSLSREEEIGVASVMRKHGFLEDC